VRVRQKTGSTWNASLQLSEAATRPTLLAFIVKPDGGAIAAWGDTCGTPAAIFGTQQARE